MYIYAISFVIMLVTVSYTHLQLEQVTKQIATQFSGLSTLGIKVNTADDLPAAASAIAQTLIPVSYTHLTLK